MIYTGYYAKTKLYKDKSLTTLAISGKVPDFYDGLRWKAVAPRYELFKKWKDKEIDNFQYAEEYKKYLNTIEDVIKAGIDLYENQDIILLCYEKSGDFCHRHVLADWIEENLGYRVEEYNDGIR